MPLFICSECGCIDNIHHVMGMKKMSVYNYVRDNDIFYPNMSKFDMEGLGDHDYTVNGVIWKKAEDVKLLCSECNSGTWHDVYDKTKPDENELRIASFSKFGYITPYDHDGLSYTVEEGVMIPNVQYGYLFDLYKRYIKDDSFKGSFVSDILEKIDKIPPSHETFDDYRKYSNFLILHDLLTNEGDNFHLYNQGEFTIEDWSDPRNVCLIALDSIVDKDKASEYWKMLYDSYNLPMYELLMRINGFRTFKTPSTKQKALKPILDYSSSIGLNFDELVENFYKMKLVKSGRRKPHWKETQSEKEKNSKLKKAEEKRKRKLQKRNVK